MGWLKFSSLNAFILFFTKVVLFYLSSQVQIIFLFMSIKENRGKHCVFCLFQLVFWLKCYNNGPVYYLIWKQVYSFRRIKDIIHVLLQMADVQHFCKYHQLSK